MTLEYKVNYTQEKVDQMLLALVQKESRCSFIQTHVNVLQERFKPALFWFICCCFRRQKSHKHASTQKVWRQTKGTIRKNSGFLYTHTNTANTENLLPVRSFWFQWPWHFSVCGCVAHEIPNRVEKAEFFKNTDAHRLKWGCVGLRFRPLSFKVKDLFTSSSDFQGWIHCF